MNRERETSDIEKLLIGGLMKVARAHAARHGIEISTIGYYAVADARLFPKIAKGGSLTVYQYGRILQWIYDRWPDDVSWPVDAPRPARRGVVAQSPRAGRPPAPIENG